MNAAVLAFAFLTPTAAPVHEPRAPDVTRAVRDGLNWLADQQKADGSWGNLNGASTTITTARAGLALLMNGSTLNRGPHAGHLRKAVEWLEKNTSDEGQLAGNGPADVGQYVPAHAAALLFLASAYDVDDTPDRVRRLEQRLEKAVAFAGACQSSAGGWGNSRPAAGGLYFDDALTTANILQALFAASKVGIKVPKSVTDKGVQYLVRSTNREGGVIGSLSANVQPSGGDGQPLPTTAAAGLLMSNGPRPGPIAQWVKYASNTVPEQLRSERANGLYTFHLQYQMARVAFFLGDTGHRKLDPNVEERNLLKWSAYRANVFKTMVDSQSKEGSWPDQTYGPLNATALALIILQLDNDYLPAFSR